MSCLLPSFSFHTHILFCSPLPCPCRAVSPTPIARERLSPCVAVCVCACVCLRVFPPDFCCLFLLTSPPSHRRRRFTRSLVGYKFLKFFSSFFFSHTLFQREKRVFPDVRLAGTRRQRMHSSSCLFTVRNAGASWIRKEQRKQNAHSLSQQQQQQHTQHFDISYVDSICGWHCEGGVCLSEREGNAAWGFSGKTRLKHTL